jgi:hypothetical protein
LLALHPIESSRRDPVTIYGYRAEIDGRTLRADLTVRDDARVDGVTLSR